MEDSRCSTKDEDERIKTKDEGSTEDERRWMTKNGGSKMLDER